VREAGSIHISPGQNNRSAIEQKRRNYECFEHKILSEEEGDYAAEQHREWRVVFSGRTEKKDYMLRHCKRKIPGGGENLQN